MPTYDYRCVKGHTFEGFSSIAARNDPRLCACGESAALVILRAPGIWGDLPGYESPIDGKWVEGRRARANDLARSGSRPYEGWETEHKEMVKRQKANEDKLDQLIDTAVETTLTEMTL